MGHPRAKPCGNFLAAIATAIIGDQHLSRNAAAPEEAKCLFDANRQGFRLIQAGHQDGEFNRRRLLTNAHRGF